MTQIGRKFETHNGLRYSPPFPRGFKGSVTQFHLIGPAADTIDNSPSDQFFHIRQGSLWSYRSEKDTQTRFWTDLRDGTVSFDYDTMRISWNPTDYDEKFHQGVLHGFEARHCGQTLTPRKRAGFSFGTKTRPEFDAWLEAITQCTHWTLEQVYRPLYTIRESPILKEQIGCIAEFPDDRRGLVLIRKYGNVGRKDKVRISNDVTTTGQIEHNHILRKVDCLQDREQVVTVHEVVRDSLKDILNIHKTLPEDIVRRICFEIVQALIHLHTRRNTLHGDLTVDNVRFAAKIYTAKTTAVKIAGFHYACEFSKLKANHEFNMTSRYCWPAEIGRESCTAKVDIWMLGTIVFEALSGERAVRFYEFEGSAGRERKCPDFIKFFAKDSWGGLSENCRDFLQKTLAYKPADRPDVQQLEKHPWLFDSLLEFKPSRHSVVTRMTRPIPNKSKPTTSSFPNRHNIGRGSSRRSRT